MTGPCAIVLTGSAGRETKGHVSSHPFVGAESTADPPSCSSFVELDGTRRDAD